MNPATPPAVGYAPPSRPKMANSGTTSAALISQAQIAAVPERAYAMPGSTSTPLPTTMVIARATAPGSVRYRRSCCGGAAPAGRPAVGVRYQRSPVATDPVSGVVEAHGRWPPGCGWQRTECYEAWCG